MLVKVPGVVRETFETLKNSFLPPAYSWVPSKKVSPFGPDVWPAIYIYMSKELHYINYVIYNDLIEKLHFREMFDIVF